MAVRSLNRTDLLKNRARIAFGCIVLGYTALAGRLLYMQGLHGDATRAQAISRRRGIIPKPARRGTIFDRADRPLAQSLYAPNIGFDPRPFAVPLPDPQRNAKREKDLDKSIEILAGILKQPKDELAGMVRRARAEYAEWEFKNHKPTDRSLLRSKRFALIVKNANADVTTEFEKQHAKLKGFGIQEDTRRAYLMGDDTLQVVGFLSEEGRPVIGLEKSLNPWLDRHPGYVVAERDPRGRQIAGTETDSKPAINGADIHLALDTTVQQIVREELQRAYEKYTPIGAEALVVDPANGDILAMVSLPTFDPNTGMKRPADLKERSGFYLSDRNASQVFEPGSTLKALAMASALDQGIITTESYFHCGGSLQVKNRVIHDSHPEAHGDIRPEDILRHSCNVCMAQIGIKMGPERLYEAEKQFGMGEPLDTHLPHEQRGSMAFIHPKDYNIANAARVAFGQSITTTPLHVAMAYAAIANGGVLMKPRLVTSLTRDNEPAKEWKPVKVRQVISQHTSDAMMRMLQAVVTSGTGKQAAIRGYLVAGKTGTATKYKRNAYVGSFIGVVPATPNPKYRAVIMVAIDEPHGAFFGADVAAPVFQQIASRLMSVKMAPEDDPGWTQYNAAHAREPAVAHAR